MAHGTSITISGRYGGIRIGDGEMQGIPQLGTSITVGGSGVQGLGNYDGMPFWTSVCGCEAKEQIVPSLSFNQSHVNHSPLSPIPLD
jgi:hypothetical protein